MDIKSYLDASSRSLTDFAQAVGTSVGHMHDLANGRRTPSLRMAMKIVAESGGAVTVDTMLPREPSVNGAAE